MYIALRSSVKIFGGRVKFTLKKSCFIVILGLSQLFHFSALAASREGGVAGGGGDAILCNDQKYYSYDYVLTEGSKGTLDSNLLNKTDPISILKTISSNMRRLIPPMADSLDDFIQSVQSTQFDLGSPNRIWLWGSNPLTRIHDESKMRIPELCRDTKGAPQIIQAVIRYKTAVGVVQYNSNGDFLAKLEENSPLQVSFLYVHEWLRDYTNDATVIMNVDRLLHETAWTNATALELLNVLRKYGLDSTKVLNPPLPYSTISIGHSTQLK